MDKRDLPAIHRIIEAAGNKVLEHVIKLFKDLEIESASSDDFAKALENIKVVVNRKTSKVYLTVKEPVNEDDELSKRLSKFEFINLDD